MGKRFGLFFGLCADDPETAVVLGGGEERAWGLNPCAGAVVDEGGAARFCDPCREQQMVPRAEPVIEGVNCLHLVACG